MNENSDALDNLAKLKHEAFGGDDEKLAVALGRPVDEVRLWFTGGARESLRASLNIPVAAAENRNVGFAVAVVIRRDGRVRAKAERRSRESEL